MPHKRLSATIAVLIAIAVIVPAAATAAKTPTYLIYKKCSTKILCQYFGATNSANTKIQTLQLGPKCKAKGSVFTSYSTKKISLNSKKKFSAVLDYSSRDQGATTAVTGKVNVSGKIYKKDEISLKYDIDGELSDGCKNLKDTTVTIKYAGSQTGG